MHWLTDSQINQLAAERFAEEIASEANRLMREAEAAGFALEIRRVAGLFGVVTILPIRQPAIH